MNIGDNRQNIQLLIVLLRSRHLFNIYCVLFPFPKRHIPTNAFISSYNGNSIYAF